MRLKNITKLFNARRKKYLDFCERTEELGRDGVLTYHYDPTEDPLSRINSVTYRKNRYCYHAFDKFPEKKQFIKDVAKYLKDEYGHSEVGDNWNRDKIYIRPDGIKKGDTFLQVSFGWRCFDPANQDSIELFSRRDFDGIPIKYMNKPLKCENGDAKDIARQIVISIKIWMSFAWSESKYPKGYYSNLIKPYKDDCLFDDKGNFSESALFHFRVNNKINIRSFQEYRHTVSNWEAFEAEGMDADEYYAYRRLKKKYKTSLRYKRGEDAMRLCRAYDKGSKYFKGSTYNNFDFSRDVDLDNLPMDGDVDEIFDAIMSIAL